MPDKIILIDNLSFIRANLPKIKDIAGRENAPLLPLSEAGLIFLRKGGLECLNYRELTPADYYDTVYPLASRWGRHWYRPRGKDITLAGGYSLGNAVEWSMIYFFCHFIRLYLTISAAIEKLKPKEIILVTSGLDNAAMDDHLYPLEHVNLGLYSQIIEVCLRNSGLNIKLKVEVIEFKIKNHDKKILHQLKKIIRQSNRIFSGILGLFFLGSGDKKIAFYEGFRHFENIMVSPVLKNVKKIHIHKIIGPSLLLKLYSNRIAIKSLTDIPLRNFKSLKFDPITIKKELSSFFVINEVNLLDCIWPRLEFLLDEYFPYVAYPDFLKAEKLLKELKPNCLVTENDSTYDEKMLVTTAKALGIMTVVMQNGATVQSNPEESDKLLSHDFYPLTADKLFVFSRIDKNWFTSKQIKPERIITTGSPRFDCYYQKKYRAGAKDLHHKTALFILNELWYDEGIITYHLSLGTMLKHITEFIRIAKNNPDIDFILRPHEDNDHWNEIFLKQIKGMPNLVITRSQPLQEIFLKANVVVGYVSTALIEAAICRIPVISLDTGEFYNFMRLWEYGLSVRAENIKELGSLIRELIENQNTRQKIIENLEKNARVFNENDDGLASQRISVELLKEVENAKS